MLLAKDTTQGKISLIKHAEDVYKLCEEKIKNTNLNALKELLKQIVLKFHKKEDCELIETDFSNILNQILFEMSFFHDFGKINPEIQKFFIKPNKSKETLLDFEENKTLKSTKGFLSHQKLSYVLFNNFLETKGYNRISILKQIISYVLLYHHGKNFYDAGNYEDQNLSSNFPNLLEKDYKKNIEDYLLEIDAKYNTQYFKNYSCDLMKMEYLEQSKYIPFKSYSNKQQIDLFNIKLEAIKTFFRVLFNSADREVSKNI